MLNIVKSNVAREASKAIFWNFFGLLVSLFSGILTARILAPEDRGLLAVAITITSVSYLFSAVGTNNSLRTFQPKESWASVRTYLQLSVRLVFLNLLVVGIAVLAYRAAGQVELSRNLFVILVLGILTFFSNQLLDVFNALGFVSLSAFSNVIGHVSTLLILSVLYFGQVFETTTGAILAYIVGFLLRVLFMLFLMKKLKIDLGVRGEDGGKRLICSGLKFWGISIGQTLTFRSDQLVLGALTSAYNVGIYAVAATPASLMQVVSNSIGQIAYREAAIGKLNLRRYLGFIVMGLIPTIIYAIFIWIVAPWLIPFVFGNDYSDAVHILRALLVAEFLLSPYIVSVRVLAGFNHPFISSASGIVGLVILIPSLVILIPLYGPMGAAIGNVIAYFVMLLIVIFGVILHFRKSLR